MLQTLATRAIASLALITGALAPELPAASGLGSPGGLGAPAAVLGADAIHAVIPMSGTDSGYIRILVASKQTLAIKVMGPALPVVLLYDESGELVARAAPAQGGLMLVVPHAGAFKLRLRSRLSLDGDVVIDGIPPVDPAGPAGHGGPKGPKPAEPAPPAAEGTKGAQTKS